MKPFSDEGINRPTASGVPAPHMPTSEEHVAMIERSRQRSTSYGLKESYAADFSTVPRPDLATLLEQNSALCTYAMPLMEALYAQIVDTHSMVVLTDSSGVVLHALGDNDFLEKAEKVAITPGVAWSEESKGTNAIGTAIAERMPALVHADQHYLNVNHILTCSAAPIFDHRGAIAGVLDVTGDYRSYHRHTMALVRMSAQMIENQLLSTAFEHAVTLHFHRRPELIGTLMEAIVTFSPGGRFLAANREALFQFGLPLAALHLHTFSSLFGLPLASLFDHHRSAAPGFLKLSLHGGGQVYARTELRLGNDSIPGATVLSADLPRDRNAATQGGTRAPQSMPALHLLDSGDPRIAGVIEKIGKTLGRDIPVLVTGETGTGKDLFAQAIHSDSPRAGGPFIAVNCASIPENLIESELFGYEDGAFTGARKNGNAGRILQANGGTLFLDEIGDMPLGLQARLLRVLQERTVTPLGSAKAMPVDFSLVCATHRNLRELIAQGAFREDLYYRLNGLTVKLPPLRERSDIDALIGKLLAGASKGVAYAIAPDVMRLFRQYRWPGNIRQLANLLRTAIVMAGNEREIRCEHLPDDFLEDANQAPEHEPACAAPAGMTLDDVEVATIRKTLEAHGGNVSAAARLLGISRNTIYRKLR